MPLKSINQSINQLKNFFILFQYCCKLNSHYIFLHDTFEKNCYIYILELAINGVELYTYKN